MAAHAGDAQQALQWLVSQQRPDGSWCGTNAALCTRDTGVVTAALNLLRQGYGGQGPQAVSLQTAIERGAAFMENVIAHDADTLARKLLVGRLTGYIRSDDVLALNSLRQADGGYALYPGYLNSEVNDTVLALNFLSTYDLAAANATATWLVGQQNGGFFQNGDLSFGTGHDVPTSAQAMLALSYDGAPPAARLAVQLGLSFIANNAHVDGTIGDAADPLHDTLWGVYAVQSIAGEYNNIVSSGLIYLTSRLDSQGSLEGNPYLTALYVQAVSRSRPDLLIAPQGIHADPAIAETGHPVTIAVDVRNGGFADASSFKVGINYQSNPFATPQTVQGLAVGATTTLTFRIDTAPEPGIYNLTAMVDMDDTVAESNERNNTAPFSVKVGQRDLVVSTSHMGAVPSRPYPDQPFNVIVTVTGGGDLPSSNVPLALFDGDPMAGGTLVEEKILSSISAGGSAIESFSVSSGNAEKTYCAVVNRTGGIRESDTTNNKACIHVSIAVQPDLTFATPRIIVPTTRVRPGDLVPLKVLVTNTGTMAATNAVVRFYADNPRTGTPIGSDFVIPSILPMQVAELAGPVFDTTGRGKGTVTLYAVADPDNAIVEADEYNNIQTGDYPDINTGDVTDRNVILKFLIPDEVRTKIAALPATEVESLKFGE